MDVINKYFNQLVFTRLEEKRTPSGQTFFIYGAGIEGMFEDGKSRYVLLMVPTHLSIKAQARINELPWDNLQTRRLHYSYRLKKQPWKPSRDLQDVPLHVTKREQRHSIYKCPQAFPFEVLLLHDPRKKSKYQFHNKIRLSAALETFASSIKYTGQVSPMIYTSPPQRTPQRTPVSQPRTQGVPQVNIEWETPVGNPARLHQAPPAGEFDDSFDVIG